VTFGPYQAKIGLLLECGDDPACPRSSDEAIYELTSPLLAVPTVSGPLCVELEDIINLFPQQFVRHMQELQYVAPTILGNDYLG
jgi:hypothetical protein